ncbi:hypothetical protein JOL79_06685 [Microbispora sp. RL4-1S]|uniref:Uncharacterized protein n=1 Tax=Microbispora oryzae TaxID=2806554 RepID=A0A941AIT8_9ACTN|nr:hypothetical protein [Microbispora oryzae]MBP2703483.1 hypothetical protein [Microbispora oryzae]
MLPLIRRRRLRARSLRPGDYIHYPCAGCRVVKIHERSRRTVGIECELDSGVAMFASHPPRRRLDVTRTYRGLRRLIPVL